MERKSGSRIEDEREERRGEEMTQPGYIDASLGAVRVELLGVAHAATINYYSTLFYTFNESPSFVPLRRHNDNHHNHHHHYHHDHHIHNRVLTHEIYLPIVIPLSIFLKNLINWPTSIIYY
ncbi:GSCOCG00005003001-RA-CDS [Cotesia congregata]|nr:GSCOCG00005003001-RA-CDS [Cotesia congregata]